jgi:outer membrane protein assembly factor BamB
VLAGRGAYLAAAGKELALIRESVAASFALGDDIAGSPVADSAGNFYVAGVSGDVYSLDGRLGKLWQYKAQASVLTSLAWRNGVLLFGCADRHLYALKDGELLWKFPTGGPIRSSPVTDRAGVTYFGAQDGLLYAVDANGRLAWKVNVRGEVAGAPAFDRDGGVYVATVNRRVVKLRE